MTFANTRLERSERLLRLTDTAGNVLLELKGHEIDDAIRGGFIDLDNCHYSMYDYARMRRELQPVLVPQARSRNENFDAEFLSRYHIRWE